MKKSTGKITALEVARIRKPGRYAVGDGVYLQVSGQAGRSWVLRYQRDGKARHMGLGPVSLLSLAQAREKARDARRLLLDGVDPLNARAARRAAERLEAARAMTFTEAAARYIAAHEAAWHNPVHRRQWRTTIAMYVEPVFGNVSVAAIDTGLVVKALEAIWITMPETAARVRGRIEAILDWAKVRGYREGDNPARWRGHLDHLLADHRKVRKVEHHAALPWAEVGGFLVDLRGREGIAARALEFTILTAARTGEALNARWSEMAGDVWTVPAERMKAGTEHRVPLSGRVHELLEALPRDGEFVFPGARSGRPLSNMSMLVLLRRMGRGDLTVHGFRSTFRDWAAESTGYPREVVEAALAHTIENKVEAAYRRGDLFDKRRRLMAQWAAFCAAASNGSDAEPLERRAVVPMRGRAHG